MKPKRYIALRIVSVIYRIAGVLIAGFGLLSFLIAGAFSSAANAGASHGIESLVSGLASMWAIGWFIGGLSCYAVGELIELIIDIAGSVRTLRHGDPSLAGTAIVTGLGLSR